jgi:methylmalonyl-CoA epimerase
MIKKFHHIGIAVKDLEEAIAFFGKTYGTKLIWRVTYPEEKFETALVGAGDVRFELLAGLGADSFIVKFIEERGEGIHHLSLEIEQFDLVYEGFKEKGLKTMGKADTEDFKAAFIHPKGNFGVLTEIIEPKGEWGK